MRGADIKARFYTFWDVSQSGKFTDNKLNYILEKAQVEYLYSLMNNFGLNQAVQEEAGTYLLPFIVTPTSNQLDITSTSSELPNFERLIALACKFVKGGVTYYEYARQLRDEEKISPLKGNVLYPKYDYTNTIIRIYPQAETCLEAKGTYFRGIFPINVQDITTTLPFTDKNVQSIINNALNIAAMTLREDGFYNMTENENRQDNIQ
jgi:hypothetical protein